MWISLDWLRPRFAETERLLFGQPLNLQICFERVGLGCHAMHDSSSLQPLHECGTRGSDLWLVHGRSRVNRGMHAGQISVGSKDQSQHGLQHRY